MIKWRDFIRLNKCLNFPQGTLLVDAVKIMKIVLRSEEINAEHKKINLWQYLKFKFNRFFEILESLM